MFVGITSGATTVWNPLSGRPAHGCCSGGFSCFRLVDEHHRGVHLDAVVGLAGAQRCVHGPRDHDGMNTSDTAPRRTSPAVFFRLGSMRLSNTGFRPPVDDSGNCL